MIYNYITHSGCNTDQKRGLKPICKIAREIFDDSNARIETWELVGNSATYAKRQRARIDSMVATTGFVAIANWRERYSIMIDTDAIWFDSEVEHPYLPDEFEIKKVEYYDETDTTTIDVGKTTYLPDRAKEMFLLDAYKAATSSKTP